MIDGYVRIITTEKKKRFWRTRLKEKKIDLFFGMYAKVAFYSELGEKSTPVDFSDDDVFTSLLYHAHCNYLIWKHGKDVVHWKISKSEMKNLFKNMSREQAQLALDCWATSKQGGESVMKLLEKVYKEKDRKKKAL